MLTPVNEIVAVANDELPSKRRLSIEQFVLLDRGLKLNNCTAVVPWRGNGRTDDHFDWEGNDSLKEMVMARECSRS